MRRRHTVVEFEVVLDTGEEPVVNALLEDDFDYHRRLLDDGREGQVMHAVKIEGHVLGQRARHDAEVVHLHNCLATRDERFSAALEAGPLHGRGHGYCIAHLDAELQAFLDGHDVGLGGHWSPGLCIRTKMESQ